MQGNSSDELRRRLLRSRRCEAGCWSLPLSLSLLLLLTAVAASFPDRGR